MNVNCNNCLLSGYYFINVINYRILLIRKGGTKGICMPMYLMLFSYLILVMSQRGNIYQNPPNMEEEELTYCLIHFCRTECHATTIKYLRKMKQVACNEKDVRVDLILFNTQLGVIFSCEDKATEATETDVAADIKKAKDLREKRLIYIKSVLPHPSLIKFVEVISSQFWGLSLTIYGSRMTENGAIIHYQKGVASLPPTFSMSEVAHFLLTVMSLQVSEDVDFIFFIYNCH